MAYEATLFEMIERHIDAAPRTLQTAPGPSGLGTDCYHCLGALLAREPKMETAKDRWLTFIGQCVHEGLANACHADNTARTSPRWLVEQRVQVGHVGTDMIEGNSDAYDLDDDSVVDWKVVGNKTLATVARYGASATYLRQVDLYGLGMKNAGHTPKWTNIMFLPREKYRIREGILVRRPWDEANAHATLKRANDIIALLAEHGIDYVLPRLKRLPGCRDCERYAR